MNDDELAAVVAAHVWLTRDTATAGAATLPAWALAARLRIADPTEARVLARLRSRWAHSGRRRG